MTMYDIILKKRDGGTLSKDEIEFFVSGYTEGTIPDYQASALLMTFFFNELSSEEIFVLTDAMKRSGDVINLEAVNGIKVDKHSTGGVGDKTTFIVAPLAAACGIPIAKMSGRGLGFTGGTVDKMESIPGMKTSVTGQEFIDQVNKIGIAVIGQTGSIAPADKKIYALRDVTATVDNLGLIASSVMSKKLASGSDALVLDVKCGNGAFMENLEDAKRLGEIMTQIGETAGKRTIAVVTDMEQPLGYGVGNSIEVIEAIETLKGRGPADITELSLQLASYMIYAGDGAPTPAVGYDMAKKALEDYSALDKLKAFISAQGGNPDVVDNYSLLPQASHEKPVLAEEDGFVGAIDARTIGLASQRSGAGRETKEEAIDLSAGIVLAKKVGDSVTAGELIATIYGNDKAKLETAAEIASSAFHIEKDKPASSELIKTVIKK